MIINARHKKYKNTRAGFSMVELMLTMTVFVLLSTVVMANFRSADNSLVLRNVAHQVALVIRKAQISGIAALGTGDSTNTDDFVHGYGVNFAMGGANDTFSLFVDKNDNGKFGGPCPGGQECVQKYTLARGYTITQLCGDDCSGSGILNSLNVLFTRPNPDACFQKDSGAGSCPGTSLYSSVKIKVSSPAGAISTITIWKTGQISVQ